MSSTVYALELRDVRKVYRSGESEIVALDHATLSAEQGEIIASKYSNPEVGRRNLEILAAATLEATLLHPDRPAPREAYLAAMDEISADAFQAYRGLVYETPGFVDYFWSSTVITEIATLNIGSRPASRTLPAELRAMLTAELEGKPPPAPAERIQRISLPR